MSFGGDPEAALVTFSNPAEAKAVYKCTEAVLNNRFIKVFWHKERDETSGEVSGGAVLLCLFHVLRDGPFHPVLVTRASAAGAVQGKCSDLA